MLDDAQLSSLTDLACRLADAAGDACLPYFRAAGLGTDDKGAGGAFDPVTAADRDAERAIRAILAVERPEDGIFGEEEAPTEGTSGLTWVIDPIDGTRAFISGLPVWGVLIAVDDGSTGRIGIVDQPYVGERFVGVNGVERASAWLARHGENRPISVRACPSLQQATFYTTAPELFSADELVGFQQIRAIARLTRYGTDCYAYALVAAGQVDLVIEPGLNPYDIAGPAALIQAAGGIVTNWRGGDCRWGGQVVASGDPAVHREALEIMSAHAD